MAFSIYSDPDSNYLYQGDLIECCGELYDLICGLTNICRDSQPKYLSIITQSCDLRVYKAKWKSETISVSFAYKLRDHARRLIDGFINNEIDRFLFHDNVINTRCESRIINELNDIIQYRGHECFLYHNDISYSIEDDYYINLRVSIPMQTDSAHEILLKNKVAQLKENFRDRLGYNISYLFSRVGVDEPDDLFIDARKTSLLSGYTIVSKEKVTEIEKRPTHKNQLESMDNLQDKLNYIEDIHVDTHRDVFERELLKHISSKNCLSAEDCTLFVKSFLNSSEIRSILKTK